MSKNAVFIEKQGPHPEVHAFVIALMLYSTAFFLFLVSCSLHL